MAAKKGPARTKRASASTGAKAPTPKSTGAAPDPAGADFNGAAETSTRPSGKPETQETGGRTAPQVSSLVTKVFELADASVGLGINVISLLAGFARTQATAAASAAASAAGSTNAEAPTGAAPSADTSSPPPAAAPPGETGRSYCIVNRLPIRPGDSAQVSFSINNDLPDAAKHLSLTCGQFKGATQNFLIPDGQFAIEPASVSIGPMDFERLVLKGAVPVAAPADTYNAWIQVAGDESMRIPVVLMVT